MWYHSWAGTDVLTACLVPVLYGTAYIERKPAPLSLRIAPVGSHQLNRPDTHRYSSLLVRSTQLSNIF